MVYYIVDGKEMNEKEYAQLEEQRKAQREAERIARWEADQKAREEAADLVRQLGQAYTAYKEFMDGHPRLSLAASDRQAADHLLYQELRQNLERADAAPRCTHVKADGVPCGSPRMKTGMLCYAHQRMLESRPQGLRLPPMEDANSIQLGLMEVARALTDRQITERTAGLLLYCLQNASSNVGRVTFHQKPAEMVVDEPVPPPAVATRPQVQVPEPSIYDELDDDLRFRLQEISDEFDRRRTEKPRRENNAAAVSGPEAGDLDRELAATNTDEDKLDQGPQSLTTGDTKEPRGEPGLGEAETSSSGEDEATRTAEFATGCGALRAAHEQETSLGSGTG